MLVTLNTKDTGNILLVLTVYCCLWISWLDRLLRQISPVHVHSNYHLRDREREREREKVREKEREKVRGYFQLAISTYHRP